MSFSVNIPQLHNSVFSCALIMKATYLAHSIHMHTPITCHKLLCHVMLWQDDRPMPQILHMWGRLGLVQCLVFRIFGGLVGRAELSRKSFPVDTSRFKWWHMIQHIARLPAQDLGANTNLIMKCWFWRTMRPIASNCSISKLQAAIAATK